MKYRSVALCALAALSNHAVANQPDAVGEATMALAGSAPSIDAVEPGVGAMPDTPPQAQSEASPGLLVAGTTVYVALSGDLSTAIAQVGDRFQVTVSQDVVVDQAVVVPKGAVGWGQVTFVSKRGAFGRPGILGISLRDLDLGGQTYRLDGRYREVGTDRNDATAAAFFAVGIVAAVVPGGTAEIPAGRELKARIMDEISFVRGATPPAVPVAATAQASLDYDPQSLTLPKMEAAAAVTDQVSQNGAAPIPADPLPKLEL